MELLANGKTENGLHHAKRSLLAWVVVIPKERWECMVYRFDQPRPTSTNIFECFVGLAIRLGVIPKEGWARLRAIRDLFVGCHPNEKGRQNSYIFTVNYWEGHIHYVHILPNLSRGTSNMRWFLIIPVTQVDSSLMPKVPADSQAVMIPVVS